MGASLYWKVVFGARVEDIIEIVDNSREEPRFDPKTGKPAKPVRVEDYHAIVQGIKKPMTEPHPEEWVSKWKKLADEEELEIFDVDREREWRDHGRDKGNPFDRYDYHSILVGFSLDAKSDGDNGGLVELTRSVVTEMTARVRAAFDAAGIKAEVSVFSFAYISC